MVIEEDGIPESINMCAQESPVVPAPAIAIRIEIHPTKDLMSRYHQIVLEISIVRERDKRGCKVHNVCTMVLRQWLEVHPI